MNLKDLREEIRFHEMCPDCFITLPPSTLAEMLAIIDAAVLIPHVCSDKPTCAICDAIARLM